ncbi:MAG: transcriptional repressor [Candidatus Pacearchaeota archaeon]
MFKGLRNTFQKEIIQSKINQMDGFFNAKELHKKVIKKDKKIGVATVYRYLKNLKDNNLIHAYVCERKTIFSKSKESHCHFTCTSCNKTEHIQIKSIDFLKGKIPSNEICHFQIEIKGLCQKCRENKREN